MKKGKEPLRTFGDLLQFYELKQQPDELPKPSQTDAAASAEIPEQSPPPAAETPVAQIDTSPTDGEAAKSVDMPSEPQAVEQQSPTTSEIPAEQPIINENN
jgi:protein Tex